MKGLGLFGCFFVTSLLMESNEALTMHFLSPSRCYTDPGYSLLAAVSMRPEQSQLRLGGTNRGNFKGWRTYCWPKGEGETEIETEDEALAAESATLEWLNNWVIGYKLCPWAAASSKPPAMRIFVQSGAADVEQHATRLKEEAAALVLRDETMQRTGSHKQQELEDSVLFHYDSSDESI
mmetsp:Transcript_44521/g.69648  ORF Transcript_44521/g.69648 Transcript_44521/m.69648 type:complete len:179 (+) Transcript_44521:106-642(+)